MLYNIMLEIDNWSPMAKKWHQYVGIRAAGIVATGALIGGLLGYFGVYVQTKTLRSSKKDELARLIAEFALIQTERQGIPSEYSTIAHWAVIRKLLDRYEKLERVSLEELRDSLETEYTRMCSNSGRRHVILQQLICLGHHDEYKIKQFLCELEDASEQMRRLPETTKDGETKHRFLMFAKNWESRVEELRILLGHNHGEELRAKYVRMILGDPNYNGK